MGFSFNASLSGLNANSDALGVVGNNIANANTVGFRSSSITFSDVFANTSGARLNGAGLTLQIGDGVQTSSIQTNLAQGTLNESASSLHTAIKGNGFFVVRGSDESLSYTRAGDFVLNNEGYLITPKGDQVQGYAAINGVITPGSSLTSLRIPIGQTLPPNTTTNASMKINLNTNAATGDDFHATVQVYDSRGTTRTLDIKFTRLSDGSFDSTATLDGVATQLSADGGASGSTPVNFTFDSTGNLLSPSQFSIQPDQAQLGGAVLANIDINLRETNPDGSPGAFNIVSYARPSSNSANNQDGFPPGELSGSSIDPNGVILAIFTNGQTRPIGQYALATFNSSEGLSRKGDNLFAETLASNQATIGAPGSGGRGLISGGYLEQSNVNITNEFVKLIEAQRGFQANSRVINNLNETFQDLLQII
ncbi:MAG TPA: flagellar hook protein FlgE [Pyrinomonadaceae bacterium]|nr:flagellar hook protein FlgE [Pyrinomonadaceae bacterium]